MYTQTITVTDTDGNVTVNTFAPSLDIRDAHSAFDYQVQRLRTDLTDSPDELTERITSYSIVTVEDDDVLAMETGFFRAELDMWCVVTMGASHEGDLAPAVKYGAYGVHFNEVPADL